MTSNYFNTNRAGVKNPKPGYTQRAKIACLSWFYLISQPDYTGGANNVVINTPHYFKDGFDWINLYNLPNSVQSPSTSTGETGAQFDMWKPALFMPGDSPELQAMMDAFMNDDLILLVEDANTAGSNTLLQFGSEANPAHLTTHEFTSGTVYGTVSKGFKIELTSVYRYQYLGYQFINQSPFSNEFGPEF